jgi:hypothetical protein
MDDNRKTTTGVTSTGTSTLEAERADLHDANRDPLTGEPGSHPVGTGVGAATGAATGAAIGGVVGGPPGALLGAALGGIAGGLAGHGVAEAVNPTEEDTFWSNAYANRPYAQGRTYQDLQPAYRYGWETRGQHANRNWNEAENDLERGWENFKGESRLKWNEAKAATRDAWDRLDRRHENDTYWRNNFSTQPHATMGFGYDEFEPAYRYGWESRERYGNRRFDEVENDLQHGWEQAKGKSKLAWSDVKHAVRSAWDRTERALPGDADRDGR